MSFEPGAVSRIGGHTDENLSGSLRANMGDNQTAVVEPNFIVRRLTPLECERLQGLPDGWTNIPGASDTARYKQLATEWQSPVLIM
jgi:DNA (cytosine-5)-methyltransferase 1